MATEPDAIHKLLISLSEDEPWQTRGTCAQPGALAEYQGNPFDVGSLEDLDLKLLLHVDEKFCSECPVRQQCDEWATADTYRGLAAGKLWGVMGRKGIPIKGYVKRKRNSAT